MILTITKERLGQLASELAAGKFKKRTISSWNKLMDSKSEICRFELSRAEKRLEGERRADVNRLHEARLSAS